MVFIATFNIILAISWRSVLLVEEIGVPGENHRLPQVTDKLYFIILHRVHFAWVGFEPTTWVEIGTDCTGSCKSNYHTITTMTVPYCIMLIRSMDIRPNYSVSVWHIYYLSFIDFFIIYLIFFDFLLAPKRQEEFMFQMRIFDFKVCVALKFRICRSKAYFRFIL